MIGKNELACREPTESFAENEVLRKRCSILTLPHMHTGHALDALTSIKLLQPNVVGSPSREGRGDSEKETNSKKKMLRQTRHNSRGSMVSARRQRQQDDASRKRRYMYRSPTTPLIVVINVFPLLYRPPGPGLWTRCDCISILLASIRIQTRSLLATTAFIPVMWYTYNHFALTFEVLYRRYIGITRKKITSSAMPTPLSRSHIQARQEKVSSISF